MVTPQRLLAGERAPNASFVTLRGETIALRDLRGYPVWLSFSRFAACPLCNFRVHQVTGQWEQRFAGAKLRHFMFFQSPPEKLERYIATHAPPFDLVADPAMTHYRAFAVETSLRKVFALDAVRVAGAAVAAGTVVGAGPDGPITRIPADFLIGRDGRIRVAHYGETIVDHVDLDEVVRFVEAES
ncbi:MAG: redoxin domain-containing protein [Myxococcales bacterium]|nr:redoxin domain-containing protein [Myxococcales bacterium]